MPYLIDGHNLIPKLGLSLEDPEDEMELTRLLQDFARIRRQQVEVYFDGAPVGQAGMRKFGTVRAHFVPRGQTADAAIRRRLEMLEKSAKNWVVVSSDHEVQSAARVHQAQFVRSEEFVKQLRSALATPKTSDGEKSISSKEVDEWLKIFHNDEE
ncbi:MAG: NYN domain-containing protein [Anaerolineales bacterium]|jgi:predicted RNA-binding protein with PIN domain|uniref:NYN domain-containing protein n=1 Tax=Candidatus Villigracilis vicinus TaxID=3140679 RepID=UPI003135F54A|nr:NYN domain-containing protein [Anaerolineales bacterium]MBK9781323.1 NYN domain-containing protein [Anaerolineales bacterium]